MNTELEKIEQMVPAKLFKAKSMGTLLKAIEIEATAEIPDVETDAGRKAITSLAYKVARSKTTIDDLGKNFVGEQKAAIAAIDAVRKTARDFLDQLKAQVRQPLTDWEEAEQARIEKITDKIDGIKMLGYHLDDMGGILPSATIETNLEKLRGMKVTKIYGEYQDEAITVKNAAIVHILDWLPKIQTLEREAEDKRVREEQEAEERRIEEEQRIAREAVDAADLEAKQEIARRDAAEAQEKADQEAREKDVKHRRACNREAVEALVDFVSEPDAKRIITAIAKGKIPYITINY